MDFEDKSEKDEIYKFLAIFDNVKCRENSENPQDIHFIRDSYSQSPLVYHLFIETEKRQLNWIPFFSLFLSFLLYSYVSYKNDDSKSIHPPIRT